MTKKVYCPDCGSALKSQDVQVVRSTGIIIIGVQLYCPNMACRFETDEEGIIINNETVSIFS